MEIATEICCPDCRLYIPAEIYILGGLAVAGDFTEAIREHVQGSAMPHPTFD